MDILTTLLGSISWPVVALVALIAAGFGLLNKPIAAISEGIVKFFRDFRAFKKDLETTEATLKGLVENISKTQDAIASFDIPTLKSDIQDITSAISDMSQRDMLSAKETLEESTPQQHEIVSQPLNTEGEENQLETLNPSEMLKNITDEWRIITDALRRRAGDLHYDGRAIAETAYALVDQRRKSPLTRDQANLLATMHGQFKSYTRRQFTVNDWMVRPIYDNFMDAAKIAKGFLQ